MLDDSEPDSDDVFVKRPAKKLKAKKRLLDDSNSDASSGKKRFKAKRGRAKQTARSDDSEFEVNSDEESESDDGSDLSEAEEEDAITISDESDDIDALIDGADDESEDFVEKGSPDVDDDDLIPVQLFKEPPKRAVDHSELSNILVNPDHGTNEQPVYFPQFLINVLKAHQIDGIRFMWKRVIKSVEEVTGGDRGGACILAHSMGLGKTIQVVSFLHIVSRYSKQLKLRKILVIVPVNTLHNWKSEVYKWLGSTGYNADLKVFMIQDTTSLSVLLRYNVFLT